MSTATAARHPGAPWAGALGEQLGQLSPALQAYFGGIPIGSHGIGEGVFTRVGTPRRWLWPVLAVLARWGIAWPVWEREVPFSIVNVPTPHGLIGVRRFRLSGGDRTMTDRVLLTPHGLRQRLGAGEPVVAELRIRPDAGGLRIESERIGVRVAGIRVSLPARWSPRVIVQERTLPDGRQHVELELHLPGVGLIYQFAGAFSYRIERNGAEHT